MGPCQLLVVEYLLFGDGDGDGDGNGEGNGNVHGDVHLNVNGGAYRSCAAR